MIIHIVWFRNDLVLIEGHMYSGFGVKGKSYAMSVQFDLGMVFGRLAKRTFNRIMAPIIRA